MSRKKLTMDKKFFTVLGGRVDTLLCDCGLSATAFAKSIGITDAYLSRLMRSRGKGGDKFWHGIRRNYPEWEGFLRGETGRPGRKPQENMVMESGPGQMALPDLEKYRVVQVIGQEDDKWQIMNLKLDRILDRLAAIELKLKDRS